MNTSIIMRLTKEKHIAPLVDIRYTHFIYKIDQEELDQIRRELMQECKQP